MRRIASSLLLALAIAACAGPRPSAQISTTRTRVESGRSDFVTKFGEPLTRAREAIEDGRFEDATALLEPIIAEYEALPREGVVYTSAGAASVEAALLDTLFAAATGAHEGGAGSTAVVSIDAGYAAALEMRAYIHVERKEYEAALAMLIAQESLEPSNPGPINERAFVLMMLNRPEQALAAYREALERGKTIEAPAAVIAMSLRGIGITLVELGRLAEARESLLESQQYDPHSPVARNELQFIEELEARRGK